MKRIERALVGVGFAFAVLIGRTGLADRTDIWSAASVQVVSTNLQLLDDGGCAVVATARYAKSDGGMAMETSAATQVAGANRTTCLDILQNKAPALFKADKGL